jgi:hypothetical protein
MLMFGFGALELLAAHPNERTEALFAADRIPADALIDLLRSGLAKRGASASKMKRARSR